MDYQRKKGRVQDRDTESQAQARTTQSSYRSYSGYQSPLEKKQSSASLPILVGTATLLPIAALVYYFAMSDSRHPIVEREETSMSDVISAQNLNSDHPQTALNALAQNTDMANTPLNPQEIARDKMIRDQVRALQEELNRQDIQKSRADAANRANENWKVEGFDAAAQETLAKNTAFWNQAAARDLDAEEIALARRRGGVFGGTAGDLYDGKPQHTAQSRQADGPSRTSMAMSAGLTSLLSRGPASAAKSCSPMRPRSPDPQCHANYPCRICGGCCCRCEAILAGFIK